MSGEQPEQIWGDTSYLDAVSTLDTVRAYKRRTFELLGSRPGMRLLDVGCGPGDDVRAWRSWSAVAGGWSAWTFAKR